MPIYKIINNDVKQLGAKENGFGNEFSLRDFFAENSNLEKMLGIRFLEKEFRIPEGRIDTLGIDENDSPVIIEYKWKENDDVFSQGLFYLNWLVKNKSHFELLVKNKLGNDVVVSWDQPRVILIAQGFNRYIKSAVQTVENVELKTYTLYEDGILHIENEYSPFPEKVCLVKNSENKTTKDEDAVYDLNYHLNITSVEMQQKFQELREMILKLPEVDERAVQKSGITYRTTKSFARFEFRGSWIQILVRDSNYSEDTEKIVKDITTHNWGFLGMIKFSPETDLSYVFNLIKSSYNSTL